MRKPRKRRPTPEETVRTIINKMFEIAGHNATYDDVERIKNIAKVLEETRNKNM